MRELELCLYYTAPAAGGMVSSREVVDVGLSENIPATGGVRYVNLSLKSDLQRLLPQIPTKIVGVRAFSHPGSGIVIEPVAGGAPNTFKYTIVTAIDLGGWLSASIINQATSQALLESHQIMCKHLNSLYAKA